MSIFTSKTGLRHQYNSLTAADLAAASNAASAVLMFKFDLVGRMCFLDNTLNQDVTLLLCNPDADSTVAANRLLWIELPTNRVINYDMTHSPGLFFDPGTTVWVYCSAAPASGKMRIAAWG